MIRKGLLALIALIIILLVANRELVAYGLNQARGQLSIVFNTVKIERVLQDRTVPDSVKSKIQLVKEARRFAFDKLGLKPSKNYTTYYDQKGKVLLWNLSACEPFEFEPKSWSFPLLGSFPYKGFFDLETAKEEMKSLKAEGYDVRIRSVSGWSTLGWTKDPILSNMLNRAEGSLAELIIHELTHSTIFVKDDIRFNENLATFIGEKGAIMLLNEKYGGHSEALYTYILAEEDSQTFRDHMLRGTAKLDSLYTSIANDPDSAKATKKNNMIAAITSSIDTLHFHNTKYYRLFEKSQPNNAYFMSYMRYHSAKDSLNDILMTEYNNDLKYFIEGMKDYHN